MRSPTWLPMSKARSPGLHETRVERIHRRIALRVAVVDIERALERGERGVGLQAVEQVIAADMHLDYLEFEVYRVRLGVGLVW